MKTQKKFIIIVGKSATGKTSLAEYMSKELGYRRYKTVTTRPKRESETDNDYEFIPKKRFLNRLDKNLFIEYNTYNVINDGVEDIWYYGTPILHNLKYNFAKYVVVLTLDGAIKFADFYGRENCKIIYLNCTDDIRELRARHRGNFEFREWARRLIADKEDFPKDKVKLLCDRIIDTSHKNTKQIAREVLYG